MKKIGHFLLALLPFLLVMGIQYLAYFFAMGISAFVENIWYVFSGNADIGAVFDDIFLLWMTQEFNTGVMIIYAALTVIIFGLWYYIKYDGCYLPSPRTVFHPLSILGIVLLVPGMQYLCTYIVNFTASIFPHWLETYEELLETAGLAEQVTIGMLIYSVLLAPVCEELVFRGVTLRQAKRCLPFWAANLLQAALFGAFHLNMMQGIYAFFLGLILGYVCEKSNSIYNAILLHMLFNFWGTVLSQFFYIGDTTFAFLFWFLFGVVMTAIGLVTFTAGVHKCTSAAHAVPPSDDLDG